MQRKKNIRLMVVLAALIVVAVILGLSGPSGDRLDVDRDIFTYDDPSQIDAVVLKHSDKTDTLMFMNGAWQVNGRYKADPQRISVLFAILKQAKVRRGAARSQADSLDAWMNSNAVEVSFFEGNQVVKSYEVAGIESTGITYYREGPGEPIYLMEIPGYRSYLAGIYDLDENGWRYPRVFDFNWSNLKDVSVAYPASENNGFDVSFRDGFFRVDQLEATDTSRITDFLDDLSLLYVNDYLYPDETDAYDTLLNDLEAQITVRDVGNNRYHMDVLGTLPGRSQILLQIDSSEYALAEYDALRKILRPRRYFIEKERP